MKKQAMQIARQQAEGSLKALRPPSKKYMPSAKSLANLKPWQPGVCPNPGGKPKRDMASEVARAVFEENPEMVYEAFVQALSSGNAYAFQVLADRAFGKLKDGLEVNVTSGLAERMARARERAADSISLPTILASQTNDESEPL